VLHGPSSGGEFLQALDRKIGEADLIVGGVSIYPTRMLAGFLGRAMNWRGLALRLLDHSTDDRLRLEQLHLRLRKFFAACSILLDPHQP
jgi:hypothetical protein